MTVTRNRLTTPVLLTKPFNSCCQTSRIVWTRRCSTPTNLRWSVGTTTWAWRSWTQLLTCSAWMLSLPALKSSSSGWIERTPSFQSTRRERSKFWSTWSTMLLSFHPRIRLSLSVWKIVVGLQLILASPLRFTIKVAVSLKRISLSFSHLISDLRTTLETTLKATASVSTLASELLRAWEVKFSMQKAKKVANSILFLTWKKLHQWRSSVKITITLLIRTRSKS